MIPSKLLEEVLSLPLEDLKQFKARIEFKLKLLGNESSKANEIAYIEELLLGSIKKHIQVPFIITDLKTRNPYNLGSKLTDISKQVLSLIQHLDISRENIHAFCEVVIIAAIAGLQTSGIPISFKTLLNFIGDVKITLDDAFPGYIMKGAIPILLAQHQQNK